MGKEDQKRMDKVVEGVWASGETVKMGKRRKEMGKEGEAAEMQK